MIFEYIKGQGIKNKLFSNIVSDTDIAQMYKLKDMILKTGDSVDVCANKINTKLNPAILEYAKSCDAAKMSQDGLNTFMQSSSSNNSVSVITKLKSSSKTLLGKAGAQLGNLFVGGIKTALIGLSVGALYKLFEKVSDGLNKVTKENKKLEEASNASKQKISELTNEFNEHKNIVDDVKKKYAELAQGIDQVNGKNLKLSTDEYKEFVNLSNQLSKLFPEITDGYDENGNAILKLTGNIESIISQIDILIKKEQDLTSQNILEEIPNVYEEYRHKMDSYQKQYDDAISQRNKYDDLAKNKRSIFNDKDANTSTYIIDFDSELTPDELQEQIDLYSKILKNANLDINDIWSSNETKDGKTQLKFDFGSSDIAYDLNQLENVAKEKANAANLSVQSISAEMHRCSNEMSKYWNEFLVNSFGYEKADDNIQEVMRELITKSDWEEQALSEGVDLDNYDALSTWLQTYYINAINRLVSNPNNKKYLLRLFDIDESLMNRLNWAQQFQNFFDNPVNGMHISLDFLVDEDDNESLANLNKRLKESINFGSLTDQTRLENYTSNFTTEQAELWLQVTQYADTAQKKIDAYERSLSKLSQHDKYNFFSEENIKSIDTYQSKVKELGDYLDRAKQSNLSTEDLYNLASAYDINADSVDEYIGAIENKIRYESIYNSALQELRQEIDLCTNAEEKFQLTKIKDYLEELTESTINAADGFSSIEDAISTLQSHANTLRNIKENMDAVGYIDSSNLDDIVAAYPEMSYAVAKYNLGLMDSATLFKMLENCYAQDEENYWKLMQSKLMLDEEYYKTASSNIPAWVTALASSYDIDFNNFKSLQEAKLKLQQLFMQKSMALNPVERHANALKTAMNRAGTNAEYQALKKMYQDELNIMKPLEDEYNETKKLLNGFNTAINVDFKTNIDTSYQNYGVDNNTGGNQNDKKDTPSINEFDESIDWISNSLKNLQEIVDDVQKTLDNTYGYENQITEIQKLNDALADLEKGYDTASQYYYDKYSNADYKKLSSLAGDKVAKEYLDKITSGEIMYEEQFRAVYSGDDTPLIEEIYNTVNDMLEDHEKYVTNVNNRTDSQNQQLDNIRKIAQAKVDNTQSYIDSYTSSLDNIELTDTSKNSITQQLNKDKIKDYYNQIELKLIDVDIDEYYKALEFAKDKTTAQYDAYLKELIEKLKDPELTKLYSDKINEILNQEDEKYNLDKTFREYNINKNNNDIQDIQNLIDKNGGRGSKEYYSSIISLVDKNKALYEEQRKDAVYMLESSKPNTEEWDKWNNELQECEDNIASCNSKIKETTIALFKLPLDKVNDALDSIDNQLNEINIGLSKYGDHIQAAQSILDDEIESQNILKEAIQDKIDALEKENRLNETNLNIQKAAYELEKLKNQKTNKIFRQGQGFVYESNSNDIKSAQEDYDQSLYEHKVFLLNQQIESYDKEISRLNKIKDSWNKIVSNIENALLVQDAIAFDSDFRSKVLNNESSLISNIIFQYDALAKRKDVLEIEKSHYDMLQDVINDTAKAYELNGIDYEEAKKRISDAVKLYYPQIVDSYKDEVTELDKVAEKQLKNVGITKDTSKDNNEVIDESNKLIVESYDNMLESLETTFNKLNNLLSSFASNAQNMANTISSSIHSTQTLLTNAKANNNSSLIGVGMIYDNNIMNVGQSHNGMTTGYVDKNMDLTNGKKDQFRALCLDELKPNEMLRKLEIGEAVLCNNDMNNIMKNFNTALSIPNVKFKPLSQEKSLSFNGNIVVNGIQDTDSFAKAVKQNLPQKLLQELYK